MNSEITEKIKSSNLKPKFFEDETVKALSWDDQWIAYDDVQTLKMKLDRARDLCLSGVMVWAVSHDLEDGRYGIALAEGAGRGYLQKSISDSSMRKVPQSQCKWTNCGDSTVEFPSCFEDLLTMPQLVNQAGRPSTVWMQVLEKKNSCSMNHSARKVRYIRFAVRVISKYQNADGIPNHFLSCHLDSRLLTIEL